VKNRGEGEAGGKGGGGEAVNLRTAVGKRDPVSQKVCRRASRSRIKASGFHEGTEVLTAEENWKGKFCSARRDF
jgi:hypothetical protein